MDTNICTFTGRTTADIELKTTTSGKIVAGFYVAVDVGYGDNKRTIFPRFVAWEGQAKYAERIPKGTPVAITAEYDMRETEKDGQKRTWHEFIVRNIKAFAPPKDKPQESGQNYSAPGGAGFEKLDASDDLPF